jgi:broad specificity phosphatase PhoE
VKELILARHGESELSVIDRLNGDASVAVRLTEVGRAQARELGRVVGPVDLVAHTEFARTRETAELAWPDSRLLVVPELNEIAFGRFEGTVWTDGYHEWVLTSAPDETCPGGGESRLAAVQRYLRGYRVLLERPEERIALVAHGAQIRYILLAVDGLPPSRVLERVEPAKPFTLGVEAFVRAIEVIDSWASAPAF